LAISLNIWEVKLSPSLIVTNLVLSTYYYKLSSLISIGLVVRNQDNEYGSAVNSLLKIVS
jgi:hypothetical protein